MVKCLNPYYAGIWSRRVNARDERWKYLRLNPYYAGIWSRRPSIITILICRNVLILIMLEYGLGVINLSSPYLPIWSVLILIMLEYGLGVRQEVYQRGYNES